MVNELSQAMQKGVFLTLFLFFSAGQASEYADQVSEYGELHDEYRPPILIDPPPILPPQITLTINRSDFTLTTYSEDKRVNTRRVIIGRSSTPTPNMTTQFSRIIVNPVWKVPQPLVQDLVAITRRYRDPIKYLRDRGFNAHVEGNTVELETIDWPNLPETGPYHFEITQDPSPNNFVGQVLFVLEDTNFIQMHDTPNKDLFLRDVRTFSAGCIRVENSQELAEYIIRESISDVLNSGETVVFTLPRPVTVIVD